MIRLRKVPPAHNEDCLPCGNSTMDTNDRVTFENDEHQPVVPDHEILIGRIVDGEIDDDGQRRFRAMADEKPALWRILAMRQNDMLQLSKQVEKETAGAENIELHRWRVLPHRLTWPLLVSGWAAMLIISLTWGVIALTGSGSQTDLDHIGNPGSKFTRPQIELTAPEHLTQYQNLATWVINEFQSSLLDTHLLDDGSIEIFYMRRIEEKVTLEPDLAAELLEAMENDEQIPPELLNRLLEAQIQRMVQDNEPTASES